MRKLTTKKMLTKSNSKANTHLKYVCMYYMYMYPSPSKVS
jgi:hypothetical protein